MDHHEVRAPRAQRPAGWVAAPPPRAERERGKGHTSGASTVSAARACSQTHYAGLIPNHGH